MDHALILGLHAQVPLVPRHADLTGRTISVGGALVGIHADPAGNSGHVAHRPEGAVPIHGTLVGGQHADIVDAVGAAHVVLATIHIQVTLVRLRCAMEVDSVVDTLEVLRASDDIAALVFPGQAGQVPSIGNAVVPRRTIGIPDAFIGTDCAVSVHPVADADMELRAMGVDGAQIRLGKADLPDAIGPAVVVLWTLGVRGALVSALAISPKDRRPVTVLIRRAVRVIPACTVAETTLLPVVHLLATVRPGTVVVGLTATGPDTHVGQSRDAAVVKGAVGMHLTLVHGSEAHLPLRTIGAQLTGRAIPVGLAFVSSHTNPPSRGALGTPETELTVLVGLAQVHGQAAQQELLAFLTQEVLGTITVVLAFVGVLTDLPPGRPCSANRPELTGSIVLAQIGSQLAQVPLLTGHTQEVLGAVIIHSALPRGQTGTDARFLHLTGEAIFAVVIPVALVGSQAAHVPQISHAAHEVLGALRTGQALVGHHTQTNTGFSQLAAESVQAIRVQHALVQHGNTLVPVPDVHAQMVQGTLEVLLTLAGFDTTVQQPFVGGLRFRVTAVAEGAIRIGLADDDHLRHELLHIRRRLHVGQIYVRSVQNIGPIGFDVSLGLYHVQGRLRVGLAIPFHILGQAVLPPDIVSNPVLGPCPIQFSSGVQSRFDRPRSTAGSQQQYQNNRETMPHDVTSSQA
jgi:hypothetical protein